MSEKWEVVGIDFVPTFELKCRHCNVDMRHLTENLLNFPLDVEQEYSYNSRALDLWLICPICGLAYVFGIAMAKEHFDEYKRRTGKNEVDPQKHRQWYV